MTRSWFGVKTAYRTEASGKTRRTDVLYDRNTTLVEERVVIFKARSFKDAIRKAEVEARAYVKGMSHKNAYGERVRQRYLGACDAFELFEAPDVGVEVFSSNRLVRRTVSDRTVLDQLIGPKESKKDARRRWRFLNHEITRELLGNPAKPK